MTNTMKITTKELAEILSKMPEIELIAKRTINETSFMPMITIEIPMKMSV